MQSDCNILRFWAFVNMANTGEFCYNQPMKRIKITNETINHAIDYILLHINEELSLGDVAAYCHFSKYYFSRMFKAQTGESVYAFIKRLKLEQSAFRLKVEPGRTVTDIGYDFGYSPSNYSWVFRQQYQTNPIEFRRESYLRSVRHPFFHDKEGGMGTFEECGGKIQIREIPDFTVLYERRIGNYHDLKGDWDDFVEKHRDFITDRTRFLERTFDDPSITDMDACIYDIGMTVDPGCKLENTCIIRGGLCAVYPFRGLAKHIYAAYQTIFHIWLPKSGYELDGRCGFDIYHKVDKGSMYMELDICLPVRK